MGKKTMNKNYESFGWQFCNSFLPLNYGEYDHVDTSDTKRFLAGLAVMVYVVIALLYLAAIFKSDSAVSDGSIIAGEDGYTYRISNGCFKIDEPVLVDDPSGGRYVNITDRVEFFDASNMEEYYQKGYRSVLLISRTNRVKMTGDSQGYTYIINYFDDMGSTSEAGRNNTVPKIDVKLIGFLILAGFVFRFAYPLTVRIYAVILSVVTKLFCAIFRIRIYRVQLKKFAIYALVPAQVLTLLGGIAAMFLTPVSNENFLESLNGKSGYSAVSLAAFLLPLIFVMMAAFAEKKRQKREGEMGER